MYEIENFFTLPDVSDIEKLKLIDKLLETEKDIDTCMDLRMLKKEIEQKDYIIEGEYDETYDDYDEGCLNCSA